MRSLKGLLLIGFLGLVASSPAMAWDHFRGGDDYRQNRHYAPPVVVERSCYPVMVPRSRVVYTYVAPYRYRTSHYFARSYGERVIVRVR
ncbi:MAG: hypothetical protein WC975_16390 [Phycisphaerae bacterium]